MPPPDAEEGVADTPSAGSSFEEQAINTEKPASSASAQGAMRRLRDGLGGKYGSNSCQLKAARLEDCYECKKIPCAEQHFKRYYRKVAKSAAKVTYELLGWLMRLEFSTRAVAFSSRPATPAEAGKRHEAGSPYRSVTSPRCGSVGH